MIYKIEGKLAKPVAWVTAEDVDEARQIAYEQLTEELQLEVTEEYADIAELAGERGEDY